MYNVFSPLTLMPTLYIVSGTLYFIHCTLYFILYTLYFIHYTLYIILCTLYFNTIKNEKTKYILHSRNSTTGKHC